MEALQVALEIEDKDLKIPEKDEPVSPREYFSQTLKNEIKDYFKKTFPAGDLDKKIYQISCVLYDISSYAGNLDNPSVAERKNSIIKILKQFKREAFYDAVFSIAGQITPQDRIEKVKAILNKFPKEIENLVGQYLDLVTKSDAFFESTDLVQAICSGILIEVYQQYNNSNSSFKKFIPHEGAGGKASTRNGRLNYAAKQIEDSQWGDVDVDQYPRLMYLPAGVHFNVITEKPQQIREDLRVPEDFEERSIEDDVFLIDKSCKSQFDFSKYDGYCYDGYFEQPPSPRGKGKGPSAKNSYPQPEEKFFFGGKGKRASGKNTDQPFGEKFPYTLKFLKWLNANNRPQSTKEQASQDLDGFKECVKRFIEDMKKDDEENRILCPLNEQDVYRFLNALVECERAETDSNGFFLKAISDIETYYSPFIYGTNYDFIPRYFILEGKKDIFINTLKEGPFDSHIDFATSTGIENLLEDKELQKLWKNRISDLSKFGFHVLDPDAIKFIREICELLEAEEKDTQAFRRLLQEPTNPEIGIEKQIKKIEEDGISTSSLNTVQKSGDLADKLQHLFKDIDNSPKEKEDLLKDFSEKTTVDKFRVPGLTILAESLLGKRDLFQEWVALCLSSAKEDSDIIGNEEG